MRDRRISPKQNSLPTISETHTKKDIAKSANPSYLLDQPSPFPGSPSPSPIIPLADPPDPLHPRSSSLILASHPRSPSHVVHPPTPRTGTARNITHAHSSPASLGSQLSIGAAPGQGGGLCGVYGTRVLVISVSYCILTCRWGEAGSIGRQYRI